MGLGLSLGKYLGLSSGGVIVGINLNKFLFLGLYSNISGGQMPNELGNDYITVSGDAGSETYQVPNTATYIAADTDYIWFKTNGAQRTTTTAELVGYDFSKTFIGYDDTDPYQMRYIGIPKSDSVFTEDEMNVIRNFFRLSIWWDGTLSAYGYVKGNRASEQSVWTPESVTPSTLYDTNKTVGWYIASDLASITKNESNQVTLWKDQNNNGNDLAGGNPIWGTDGILFNGVSDYLRKSYTLAQPKMVYAVLRQVTWTANDRIWDGYSAGYGALAQVSSSPRIYLGTIAGNSDLTLNTFKVVRALYDGVNSKIIVNNGTTTTGDYGSGSVSGFTLGCRGGLGSQFSNIEVKEIIIRNTVDDESVIYNYLKDKYSL